MPVRSPHVGVGVLADDLIVAIDEAGVRPVPGRLGPLILPLVDDRRSILDISAALEGQATIADVAVGVMELVEEKILVTDGSASAAATPHELTERAATPPRGITSIVPIGEVNTAIVAIFVAAMSRVHDLVPHTADGSGGAHRSAPTFAGMRVVLVDDYLSDELDAINRESLRTGSAWLLVKPVGSIPWVGPMFIPASGNPCWKCLAMRLKEASPVHEYLRRHFPGVAAPRYVPPVVPAGIRQAGAAAVEWCRRPPDARRNSIIRTFDPRTGLIQDHPIAVRPGCSACGGTDRRRSLTGFVPATLLGAELPPHLAAHVSPVTGIVARLSCSSQGPAHVALADHIFPPEIELPDALWRACRRRTAGSGSTAMDARISAVAEALERYSGVYRDSDNGRRSTYEALGAAAIHPNAVMGFSGAQYTGREDWNRRHPARATRIPDRFDEQKPRSWTAVAKLGCDEIRWLPTALCYFGAPEHERDGCATDSNGCAAGETQDAAVARGFLELVERDAVGIWWYNRVERPGVDLLTVPDPFVQSLVAHHRHIKRTLAVLDLTTDLEVPAFAALSAAPSGDRLTIGFGADFDAVRALRHALLELSLFLPELAAGRRRQLFSGPEPTGAYLQPLTVYPWSAWANADDRAPAMSAVDRVRAVADRNRLDVFVLDQTRADVGIPVVRVIGPGLCHFWPRFAPERLFSVPLRLGWRSVRTREDQLNPSHILV